MFCAFVHSSSIPCKNDSWIYDMNICSDFTSPISFKSFLYFKLQRMPSSVKTVVGDLELPPVPTFEYLDDVSLVRIIFYSLLIFRFSERYCFSRCSTSKVISLIMIILPLSSFVVSSQVVFMEALGFSTLGRLLYIWRSNWQFGSSK